MDTLTPRERSARMALVRSRDTKPEIRLRKLIHSLGYRFRLRATGAPGKPDIVFPRRRKVIFVHGCFWHRHPGCKRTRIPKSRTEFWESKFRRNVDRDEVVKLAIIEEGWQAMTVWECESDHLEELTPKLQDFLGGTRAVD